MTYKYISGIEPILSELKGQLAYGTSTHIGGQTIDPAKLERKIAFVESLVYLILDQIYVQPLQGFHPILEEAIVSRVARLMREDTPIMGAGSGNQQQLTADQFDVTMAMLTAGHNIVLPMPGMIPQQNVPGVATPQPILLPGELLRTNPPDTLTRNVTVLNVRRYNVNNLGIDWGGGFGDGQTAIGAERPAF